MASGLSKLIKCFITGLSNMDNNRFFFEVIGARLIHNPNIWAMDACQPPVALISISVKPLFFRCRCREDGVYRYSSLGVSCKFHKKGTVKKKTPPGFKTRYTSFKTTSGSGQCSNTSVPKAQAKSASRNGIFVPSQVKSGFTLASYSNAFSISKPI